MTALYLQFLNHQFFGVVRHTSLVQQSVRQEVGVGVNKLISTMQAAEDSNYSRKDLVNLLVTHLLKTTLHLVITVESNIVGSVVEFIHKVLETLIARLLELDVI